MVGTAVMALQSFGILSEGQGIAQDILNGKVYMALKKAGEAIAMTIKASSNVFWVAIRKLIQLIPENNWHLLQSDNCILKATSFTSNATWMSLPFLPRS